MIRFKTIIKAPLYSLVVFGISLLPSLFVSIVYKEWEIASVYLKLSLFSVFSGLFFLKTISAKKPVFRLREGFIVVSFFWIFLCLLSAMPYLMTGYINDPVNAIFEAVSGITTTGSTTLSNFEILPKSILFWRSFTEWLGGLLIVTFAISFFPALCINTATLSSMSVMDPMYNKLYFRIDSTFKSVISVYLLFSAVSFILLLIGKMNPFDALLAMMAAVSTGGFSNYADGISHFGSLYIELVVASFSLLVCINFTLYRHIPKKRFREFFADRELQMFLMVIILATLSISLNLWAAGIYDNFFSSLRGSFFRVTGFLSASTGSESPVYPPFTHMVLIVLLLIGSSSRSAGSGIKAIRLIILFKLISRSVKRKLHPRMVQPIKVGDKTVSEDNINHVATFLYLYFILFMLGMFFVSFENIGLDNCFTVVASCISNCGQIFPVVTETISFKGFSSLSKIWLCITMLLGKLEIFAVLVIFLPSFWRSES